MKLDSLRTLFVHELNDLHDAENCWSKQPRMARRPVRACSGPSKPSGPDAGTCAEVERLFHSQESPIGFRLAMKESSKKARR